MGVIVGKWLGQPQTIAGKDSKQPIIHFWAYGYLVPFAALRGFPGLHEEWIVRVQGTFTTGTTTTIGNTAPLHLLLDFVLMQTNCQVPTKTISGDDRALLLFSFSYPPLNKKHKITDQNE
jgi:hypothetical protein